MASRNIEIFKSDHQAFNRRDFDAIVNTMAEDVIYRDRARGVTFRGRTGFKEFMQSWVAAFSNYEISEPKYIDGGDVVVAQFVARGVNDGPLGPLPATGKQVSFDFCEIVRFNDKGQVIAGDAYYNQLSMMVQLGHAQAPQAAMGG